MEKIVIDLNQKETLKEFRTSLTDFGHNVRKMLLDLYKVGFDFPVSIKGTQKQIESFFRALKNEKRYMDSYMRHGLGDGRTMMSKRDLERAVSSFERETGLRWPFKN
jgi:hypothetical protein